MERVEPDFNDLPEPECLGEEEDIIYCPDSLEDEPEEEEPEETVEEVDHE